ncbi:MAG: hypothetical protein U0527_02875 [Candidatus Eisenbacteria bacterium]
MPGTDHSVTITGLDGCLTYYFNVRAFDSCGHQGDYIAGNQATATTSAACNDTNPAALTALTLTTYNNPHRHSSGRQTRPTATWPLRDLPAATASGPYTGTGSTGREPDCGRFAVGAGGRRNAAMT